MQVRAFRRELRRTASALAAFAVLAVTGSMMVLPDRLREQRLRERGVTVVGTLTGGETPRHTFPYRYTYDGIEFTGESRSGPPDRSPVELAAPAAGEPVAVTLDPADPRNSRMGDPRTWSTGTAPARIASTAIGVAAVLSALYLLVAVVLGVPGPQAVEHGGGGLPPVIGSWLRWRDQRWDLRTSAGQPETPGAGRPVHGRRRDPVRAVVAVALVTLTAVAAVWWAGPQQLAEYLDVWLGR